MPHLHLHLHLPHAACRYKNKGVQVLLDAISTYLPSPYEKTNEALDTAANEAKVVSVKQNIYNQTLVVSAKLQHQKGGAGG